MSTVSLYSDNIIIDFSTKFRILRKISSEFFEFGYRMNREINPLFDQISQNFSVPLFGLTTVAVAQ